LHTLNELVIDAASGHKKRYSNEKKFFHGQIPKTILVLEGLTALLFFPILRVMLPAEFQLTLIMARICRENSTEDARLPRTGYGG